MYLGDVKRIFTKKRLSELSDPDSPLIGTIYKNL